MPRVCPRCNDSFTDRLICPKCSVRLLPSGSAMYEVAPSSFPAPEMKWQQTLLGRAVVGLMLSQGLYYALWQLCTFIILLLPVEGLANAWSNNPSAGWVWWVLQAIQALSLLVGGLMVGAGHRRGLLLGLALGLVNDFLFLSTQWLILRQLATHQPLSPEALYGQTAFQVICGGLGGLLGSLIWKPVLQIMGPGRAGPSSGTNLTTLHGVRRLVRPFRGKIAWIRVGCGALLAAAVSMWTQYILRSMMDNPNIKMELPTQLHYMFVTWEFSILFLLVGAAVGGSNTKNGLKQGLLVGLLTSVLLIGLHFSGQLTQVPQTILLKYFLHFSEFVKNVGGDLSDVGQLVLMTVLTVVPVGLIGGWFGGQLLPPLLRLPRQKRGPSAPP